MTQFLLIRHGSTDALDVMLAGWTPRVGLNAAGEAEVQRAARHLAGRPVDQLYTSPLERTRRTADILAEALGVPLRLDARLGELRFGEWTGKSFEALRDEPSWHSWNSFRSGTRVPAGELMLETQARAVSLLVELRDRHPDATVALVSHGDVIKSVLAYFLGMPLDLHTRLEISPASITELELSSHHVRVSRLNEIAPP